MQIKALLGAIQQSNDLRRGQDKGLRWGCYKRAVLWHREGEVSPISLAHSLPTHQPRTNPQGWRAQSVDAGMTHIKGWPSHRTASAWEMQGARCRRVGDLTFRSREYLQNRILRAPLESSTFLLGRPKPWLPTMWATCSMQVPACRLHMLWGWKGPLGPMDPA